MSLGLLTKKFGNKFSAIIKMRGEVYSEENRVLLTELADSKIRAEVYGTDTYIVKILWDPEFKNEPQFQCDCPYFSGGEFCKHLWASLVEAETKGVLKPDQMVDDLRYSVDLIKLKKENKLVIGFFNSKWNPQKMTTYDPRIYKNSEDRQLLSFLFDIQHSRRPRVDSALIVVEGEFVFPVLTMLAKTGRLFKRAQDLIPLKIDSGAKFEFGLFVLKQNENFRLYGRFERNDEKVLLKDGLVFPDFNFFFSNETLYPVKIDQTVRAWIDAFQKTPNRFIISESEMGRFLETVLNGDTPVDLPDDLSWPTKKGKPQVRTQFFSEDDGLKRVLHLRVEFEYENRRVASFSRQKSIVDPERRMILQRNEVFEKKILEKIQSFGCELPAPYQVQRTTFVVPQNKFLPLVEQFRALGWTVEAEGKKVRVATDFKMKISSGVDWFDLEGDVDFDGMTATLPALIAAIQNKEQFVILDDGTVGMLPSQWLEKYTALSVFSSDSPAGKLRFKKSQAILLDLWLREERKVEVDKVYRAFKKKLEKFDGVKTVTESSRFIGELRPYQREGLSWLHFLEHFGVGGILADDMGLGKTIQCLAFLEQRQAKMPSLVVAPKSLVFNWIDEASRFTPHLRVLNYTGIGRDRTLSELKKYDLIVTTYQTLRIDIEKIKDIEFDYAVIDEAQAIKNEDAQITKATKLIKAKFRLAMTGTPVENSISDLFSISEFSNPGLLGRKALDRLLNKNGEEDKEANDRALKNLATALRPFILRRTKSQVLKELPAKSEQIIGLDLLEKHRAEYDELKFFFKAKLDKKISEEGYGKARFQVLTALLRLRQAAIHPGLIDKTRVNEPSAKLNALMDHLKELTSEGHRALVFSQFTSFLSIVRAQFHRDGIKYQYIDGQTKDRQEVVKAFKEDSECKVFLMSLKAGGLGLNLTEADYVFLMDPWWNPAVETQAIDRAHRIGQTNKVFAYKLISKGTVEEKILELQKSKKILAEAVISTEQGFLKNMTVKDLEFLLS